MGGPERNGYLYNIIFRKYGLKFRIYDVSEAVEVGFEVVEANLEALEIRSTLGSPMEGS